MLSSEVVKTILVIFGAVFTYIDLIWGSGLHSLFSYEISGNFVFSLR